MTASSPRPDPRDFRKRLVAREPLLGSFLKFTVPQPSEILGQIEPLLLIAPGSNWLANEDTASSLTFLHKQNLG